jgi:hypothetical protein
MEGLSRDQRHGGLGRSCFRCEYRVGFDNLAIPRLDSLGSRFEITADILHPWWRGLLRSVGITADRRYNGPPTGLSKNEAVIRPYLL